MGGRGSGRSAGFGFTVDKCHEYQSIDLAWLKRRTLLVPGHRSSLTWSCGGEQTGSIRIALVSGGLLLSYRHRQNGGDWRDVNEVVPIVETQTNFGARRQWFCCLGCKQRCRILYGGALFRCRKCHLLKYDTQYEPPFARAATRALKIRGRLGGKGGIDDPFPAKPKGMHWKTYRRLEVQEGHLQDKWSAGIMARWRLIGGSGGIG